MKNTLLLIVLFWCMSVDGQTNIIAYKSHSGKVSRMSSIDGGTSNFGGPEIRYDQFELENMYLKQMTILDSVCRISDTSAIMISKIYGSTVNGDINRPYPEVNNEGVTEWFFPEYEWIFQRDTVYHHPLFVEVQSIDSIKGIMESTYNFQVSPDSIVFVGYDNSATLLREQELKREWEIKEGRVSERDQYIKSGKKSKKEEGGPLLLLSILLPALLLYILGPLAFRWAKNDSTRIKFN